MCQAQTTQSNFVEGTQAMLDRDFAAADSLFGHAEGWKGAPRHSFQGSKTSCPVEHQGIFLQKEQKPQDYLVLSYVLTFQPSDWVTRLCVGIRPIKKNNKRSKNPASQQVLRKNKNFLKKIQRPK